MYCLDVLGVGYKVKCIANTCGGRGYGIMYY